MVCDDCSKGKYQSGTCTKDEPDGGPAGGCIRCKACPAGQYSDQSKQSSCKQCDAGKSNGNVGSQAENNCEICAGGKFSENDGSTSCDLCPAGYISLVGGTANDHDDCSACTPGKYAASDGASTCSDCDPGKYASENHETSCSFCQSGQETDKGANKGGSRCVTCLKGNFEDVRSSCYCHCFLFILFVFLFLFIVVIFWQSHQCKACPKGWNQENDKQSSCVECPVGKISSSSQTSVECTNCHNGDYINIPGQTACASCLPGTFSLSNNQPHSSCEDCPQGFHASSQSSASCVACTARKYQDQRKQAECENCIAGQYSDTTGQIACTICGSGSGATNGNSQLSYQNEEGKRKNISSFFFFQYPLFCNKF
jgi:hypothetical protein